MKEIKQVVVALCFIFHVAQGYAQATPGGNEEMVMSPEEWKIKFASTITKAELKEHLEVLASDAYEGRETGKPGQKKAAQYIADYYKALGIEPCNGGSYFQQYPLKTTRNNEASLEINGKEFKFIEHFYFFGGFEGVDVSLENCVFAGYGIEEEKYNDYEGLDVKGKVVLVLSGEPKSKGKSLITGNSEASVWAYDMESKNLLAKSKGAKAMILIDDAYSDYISRIRYWLEQPMMQLDKPGDGSGELIPYAVCREEVGDALLAGAKKKPISKHILAISKKGRPKSFDFTGNGIFHAKRVVSAIAAENVLAYIEGSDPKLKNEIVVVSAHYDHIGITNGEINNGADDDGSGTVSTLEIAEALMLAKKEGFGTRRSILILNVSGEEKGLLGSEWYSEYPVFPLENTVCDLNVDMIGRKDSLHTTGNYVYLIGSDKLSTELHTLSENCNSKYTNLYLDYTYNDPNDPNRFYYRSDHYNFAKHNIPVIFYFTGVHEDYHKPGDDVEKIMFDKMETIARLIFYTAWEVANRDEKLKVDVKNDFKE
ncbi:MAG: M28 family peptidase [Flavobacteriales bacterium]|nr:M28 family peptidase [Flavobacteriales bacterium]